LFSVEKSPTSIQLSNNGIIIGQLKRLHYLVRKKLVVPEALGGLVIMASERNGISYFTAY